MFTGIKCFMYVLCILGTRSSDIINHSPIHQQILANYKSDVKTLFKVWHFIFNKSYDYNTVEGIQKFRNFKQNFKIVEAHNTSGKSYSKALNHFADLTSEEALEMLNVKRRSKKEIRKGLKRLSFNLDDYEDEDVVSNKNKVRELTAFDYRNRFRPARDQLKTCSHSDNAFSAAALVEAELYNLENAVAKDYVSPQHLVDCDTTNNKCRGGWVGNSLEFLKKSEFIWDADYPYEGDRSRLGCKRNVPKSAYRVSGYEFYDIEDNHKREVFENFLIKGPVISYVGATKDWLLYSGGIITPDACDDFYMTAYVVLVGWQPKTETTAAHWIVRNSWSSNWGEQGYARIADEDSKMSCWIEELAFRVTGLTKTS